MRNFLDILVRALLACVCIAFIAILIKVSAEDKSILVVVIGAIFATGTALVIEYIRLDKELVFRRQDRAIVIAKSMSKCVFQIQNANYIAARSGQQNNHSLNDIVMNAQGELAESSAAVMMFLTKDDYNKFAELISLLSKVVTEINQMEKLQFDLYDCKSYADLAKKHDEIMEILKRYANR